MRLGRVDLCCAICSSELHTHPGGGAEIIWQLEQEAGVPVERPRY